MRRRLIQQSAAQTVIFDGLQGETFVISMGTSVSTLRVKNVTPGRLYVFLLKQNQAGGHSIAWGDSIRNGVSADPRPNAVTAQSFIADTGGILKANLPGTWSAP
jgi:hypothetical protein